MPELPEVETVRVALESKLVGARLSDVRIHRADLRRPFPQDFARQLDGEIVRNVARRAKYLLIYLTGGDVWVTHLGMTGIFDVHARLDTPPPAKPKHLHFQCIARKGAQAWTVDFYDRRRFGFMLLVPQGELADADWYRELGVEPLSEGFNADYLLRLTANRKRSLKTLLMEQEAVAGLGNIYSGEALWRGRLNPSRGANTLTRTEANALVKGIKRVLHDAIDAGVASLGTDGELGRDGYFAHAYKVYDREGLPCPRRDGGRIEKIAENGRSSFFCPRCQK